MRLNELWRQRCARFWLLEIAPNVKYIANSGAAVFLFLGFIVFSIYYAKFVRQLPPDFPVLWTGVLLIGPLVAHSPLRTYLQAADALFLLPLETRMGTYFRPAFLYGITLQGVLLIAALIVYWPLYSHGMNVNANAFSHIAIPLIVLKAVNLYSAWRENQFQYTGHRIAFALLRWGLAAGLVYTVLKFEGFILFMLIAFAIAAYMTALRLPPCYKMFWLGLIRLEETAQHRFRRILSWFVDVPQLPAPVKNRSYFRLAAGKIAFRSDQTYTFLLLKTFFRSDLFGMMFRLMAVGGVIIVIFPNIGLKSGFYALFAGVAGMQLSMLEKMYKSVFWKQIYPLPEALYSLSADRTARRLHLAAALLLCAPAMASSGSFAAAAVFPVIGLAIYFGYHWAAVRTRRRGNG